MIHRRVRERLQTLAPYLTWDNDPYIVITPEGRLVWMLDGYTTSDAHPFSREIDAYGGINYMRNAVKATVDAYDGETHIYVFDSTDPVIEAYRTLFPSLYEDASKHAGRVARAYALCRRVVPRAIGYVPRVSHAESAIVLQQRRRVGAGEVFRRPECRAAAGEPRLTFSLRCRARANRSFC